jgi:hypothetical protein
MPPPCRFAGQPPRALRAQVVRPAKLPASGQNGIYRKNDTQLLALFANRPKILGQVLEAGCMALHPL